MARSVFVFEVGKTYRIRREMVSSDRLHISLRILVYVYSMKNFILIIVLFQIAFHKLPSDGKPVSAERQEEEATILSAQALALKHRHLSQKRQL